MEKYENWNDFDAHSGNDLYAMMSQQLKSFISKKLFQKTAYYMAKKGAFRNRSHT